MMVPSEDDARSPLTLAQKWQLITKHALHGFRAHYRSLSDAARGLSLETEKPPSAVRRRVQWRPLGRQISQDVAFKCESDERNLLISLEGGWTVLRHPAVVFYLTEGGCQRLFLWLFGFSQQLLMGAVWRMRQVLLHSGKIREDVTVGFWFMGTFFIPMPEIFVGSVGSGFKRQELICVLEIKLRYLLPTAIR